MGNSLKTFLGNRCAVASRRHVPQFHQKAGYILRVKQSPFCSWPNSRTGLQRFHTLGAERADRGVHILNFEQNVVQASAFLLQEFFIGISFSLYRLDKFQLQVAYLYECLPKLDALFFALLPIFRFRPVRPFDESEGNNSKEFGEQLGSSFEVANNDPHLYSSIQFYVLFGGHRAR
jgi:hypothetical protein